MKHYELLKLAPGADPVQVQEKLWKAYRKLDDELDWLNHPVVYRRGEAGRSDYDLMVVVELDGEERLDEYETHPLTAKLREKLEGAAAGLVKFDHY